MNTERRRASLSAVFLATVVAGVWAAPAAGAPLAVEAFTAPFRDLEIASEVGGVVLVVEVEEGDRVAAGGALVKLKDDMLRAQSRVDEARVEAAYVQVDAAKANHESLRKIWEDTNDLFGKGIASEEDELKARLEMELARLEVLRADVQRKVAELTVEADRAALERTVIRAPCDGEVVRVLRREGEAVEPLGPVVRLVSLDPLYVTAPAVPIETMGRLSEGTEAELVLEGAPGEGLKCTVCVVDRVADPASGTYRVRLLLPNPDLSVPAGAKGTVSFVLPGR